MLYAGMVLQKHYEIRGVIGQGGMSTVYQARDLNTGKLLAIKDVKRSGNSSDRVVEQSLVGEGKMLKQLSNPHLPRIYDIIENPENFMLVMDFIEGESLDKVIAERGAQPVELVLEWGMQICEVFHYLHTQPIPIIYRDMKPANVILKPDGTLMMIDFGTARTQKLDRQMQEDTICIGTEGFAAPEQYGGHGQSDARTDIFCLGGTLYNMVTGQAPRAQGMLPLEYLKPELKDTPIAQIINRCLRGDPDARYQTALELHEDLYAARTGTFGQVSRTGFRKAGWQKQDPSGNGMISSGLSTIFSRSASPEQKPEDRSAAAATTIWNGDAAQHPSVSHQPQAVPDDGLWGKLMLIGLILSVVFILMAGILIIMGNSMAGAVFLVLTIASAGLAVVSLILSRRVQADFYEGEE